MINWETSEVNLIITNTEGLYLDMLRGCYIKDIVDGCPQLFTHVNLDEVDFEKLTEIYNEEIEMDKQELKQRRNI